MRNLNHVFLIGRLTRDPELSYTRENKPFCNFSLAVNFGKGEGEVDFFEITAWDKTAEIVNQYVKKGAKVAVDGRLKQSKWADKQTGKNMSKVIVWASGVEFLDAYKSDGAGTGQYAPQGGQYAQGATRGYGGAQRTGPATERAPGRPGARPAPRNDDDEFAGASFPDPNVAPGPDDDETPF